MTLTAKSRSELSISSKSNLKSAQLNASRSSLNLKLPTLAFRSPVISKSDRQLFNSQFSHLPAGAVVMFPPRLKEQEGCINYFAKNVIDRVDHSVPGKREAYDAIKKTMCYEEVERVLENSRRTQSNQLLMNRKKGSMYLSEFWTKKQTLKVIKTSELDKAYDASKEIEREGLPARLKKLEGLYDKRKDINGDLEMLDVRKILQDFENQGLNAPVLKLHNHNYNRRKTPLVVRTETSILDTEIEEEIQGNTERVKKLAPSILEIPSSVYDGNTCDTISGRSKSRSNVSSRLTIHEGKGKSISKLVIPKLSGTLTDLGENTSIQDVDSHRYLFGSSPGHSRIDTCPSYPVTMIEEGQDLLSSNRDYSAREKNREREESRVCGLETIREIAKGGKENKENRGVRITKNLLSERSHKSYDGTLKQKIEMKKAKALGVSQDKKETSVKANGRSFKNGRKNMWIAIRRSDNTGEL